MAGKKKPEHLVTEAAKAGFPYWITAGPKTRVILIVAVVSVAVVAIIWKPWQKTDSPLGQTTSISNGSNSSNITIAGNSNTVQGPIVNGNGNIIENSHGSEK